MYDSFHDLVSDNICKLRSLSVVEKNFIYNDDQDNYDWFVAIVFDYVDMVVNSYSEFASYKKDEIELNVSKIDLGESEIFNHIKLYDDDLKSRILKDNIVYVDFRKDK